MTRFDQIYKEIVNNILTNGMKQSGQVRTVYADGEPAYTQYLYGVNFAIHPEDGLPILQSKRVAWKTAFREMDWIWRSMSNDVKELQAQNCHIWDEWQKEDGTIGPAYGARLAHPTLRTLHRPDGSRYQEEVDQVSYIINQIKYNPSSRRIMTTLYETDYLSEMALEPCVWTTNWNVDDKGKLHLFVKQRSCDVCAGFPFNVVQYHLLHRRIAQVTGRQLGSMYWTIDNAHIYDRHIETVQEQVNQDLSALDQEPALILPDNLDYFNVPLSEAKIENYQHLGSFKFEIAI